MEIVAKPQNPKRTQRVPRRRRRNRPLGQAKLRTIVKKTAAINDMDAKKEMSEIRTQLRKLRLETHAAMPDKGTMGPKYFKYIANVIDPEHHTSKLPDSINQPCALYKSVRVLPVLLDYSSNVDGKFAIFVRPIIGNNPATKEAAQIMISKPGCTDILDDVQYDYYADQQVSIFYSGIGGAWGNFSPSSSLNAVCTIPAAYSGNQVSFGTGYSDTNLTVHSGSFFGAKASLVTNVTTTPFQTFNGYTLTLEPNYDQCLFTNLSGWHHITATLVNPGSNAVPTTKSFFVVGQDVQASGTMTVIYSGGAALTQYINPAFENPAQSFIISDPPVTFVGNTYNANQGLMAKINFYLNCKEDVKYFIGGSYVDNFFNSGQIAYTFTKVDAPPNSTSSSSFVTSLRPIAQSVLLTNVSPNLYKNGTLAAASLVDGEQQGFLNPSSEINFRTIAGMSSTNLDESGRLNTAKQAATGVYTYWVPYQNITSANFRTVQDSNNTDFGGIVIAGNVANVSSSPTAQNVFFLKVVTTFEYVTANRLIVSRIYNGETNEVIKALRTLLDNKNIIFDNPAHMSKIMDRLACAISPIYGISKLTGTNVSDNFSKFSSIAAKLLKAAPDAEGLMDLLPILAGAL